MILKTLLPGDIVLADKGFDTSESFGIMQENLHIPPFTEGKSQLSALEVESTHTIANLWIHIEQVIGCVRHNRKCPEDPAPLDLLHSYDANLACKNLCWFAMETRREDGKPYLPASLRCLLSVLNRILQDNKALFSVFDEKDHSFLT